MSMDFDGLERDQEARSGAVPHVSWPRPRKPLIAPVIAVDALMLYWDNTEPDELLRRVYTDPAPSYLYEKMEIWKIWKQGLTRFWGQIDNAHRAKLMDAAWAKYGEQATKRGESL